MRATMELAPDIQGLGFEVGATDALARLTARRQGLVIVSGTYASGRSTTVRAMLNECRHQALRQIVFLDSPAVRLSGVLYCQLPDGCHHSAAPIVNAAHSHPDVIVIDQVNCQSIARAAFHACVSGIKVIAVLHAISCEDAYEQWIRLGGWGDVGIDVSGAQGEAGLAGIVHHTRRNDGHVQATVLTPDPAWMIDAHARAQHTR